MAPLSDLPGRLRLESEAILGRRELACALEHRIAGISGVLAATVNFRTSRVLVRFDETMTTRCALDEMLAPLLSEPESCGNGPKVVPSSSRPEAKTVGRNLLLDLMVHAVLPRPFDLLVPAISALRR